VGTHALIQDEIDVPKLGLAIVDEQHRFGVMQRALLREKGERPHILAMSATPIPRSLAFTLYGELDVSVIDEMPKGRQQIRTRWIKPEGRAAAYNFISKQIESGRQAFIIGLLHGRLDLRDKEQTMGQFQRGDIDIIVATSLVEVGIDVPNATVMLVDGADRFGLAQLHQFRGRVGRGRHQSYCLLLSDAPGPEARERLKLVERIHDGFHLAEEDLRIRGAGDYMGTRQSGLPSLMVASITKDQDILLMARQEANSILDLDPTLQSEENVLMLEHLNSRIGELVDEIS
jgi:ATP-dependent DNA helicase RecG